MSADAKPYTSEEMRSSRTDPRPDRMLATVEALERVTKERDEARRELEETYADWEAETKRDASQAAAVAAALKESDGVLRSALSREAFDARWGPELESLGAAVDRIVLESRAQRDAALAACAVYREVLEHAQTNVRALTGGDERRIAKALSTSAGRGWVSPEEYSEVMAVVQEASARIHGALIWGFNPTLAVSGLVRAVDALIDDRNARVSPEAFDAALREVAGSLGTMTSEAAPRSALVAAREAVIAAAKAKHGGGR